MKEWGCYCAKRTEGVRVLGGSVLRGAQICGRTFGTTQRKRIWSGVRSSKFEDRSFETTNYRCRLPKMLWPHASRSSRSTFSAPKELSWNGGHAVEESTS